MASPGDKLDMREAILLDTNPTFGRLVWPLLELMVITDVCWLLIGFINGPAIAPGDLQSVRQLLLLAWLGSILWHVICLVLSWLEERFVLIDKRIILCRDILRPQMISIGLHSVRVVNRRGGVLYPQTCSFSPPLTVGDVPSPRKAARLVSRLTQNFGS